MGGLAGIVHFRGEPPDVGVLERMAGRLAHRGPDGSGQFLEGPVAFAHRRRQIVPTRSVQPLVDPDFVLLLDGWIYDHERVARELGQADPKLPDSVVLLEAWRRYGPDFVSHVEGNFAVAVWDRRQRALHLLRDRMGARPLYWARQGHRFAFASELPALLELPWVGREIARENLSEYLSFRVVHAPRTLVRDVFQLEPAGALRVSVDDWNVRTYWRPTYAPLGTPRPSESELIPRLQEAVKEAVKLRLVQGAPAALYLSGGLGSTAIAAAARSLNRTLPTYTMQFADDPNPESPFAGRVAKLLGLEHHEVIVGSADLAAAFQDGIVALGHPVGNPATFLQLLLARAAGVDARLVLSGDGGEELFGGRMLDGLTRRLRAAEAFSRLPPPVRLGVAGLLGRIEPVRKVTTPVERYGLDLEMGGSDLFTTRERARLFRDPALARPQMRREVLAPFYADLATDPVNAILHAYLRSWVQDESLVRADRTAAAAGLDIRFPLLDTAVVSMAAALPGSSKVRRVGGSLHSRWPLRAMVSGVLPPPLVHRPKRGMPAPLDPWLSGPGRLFFAERFARLREDRERLWDAESLDALRKDVHRKPGVGLRLWALFILDAWIDTVLRGSR